MTDDDKYKPDEPRSPEAYDSRVIVSPDTRRGERIPPGQSRTRKWPVLHWGTVPQVSTDDWTLEVTGLVEQPLKLTWQEFLELPQVEVVSDFHCVTQWSRLDNLWSGVSVGELLGRARPLAKAQFAILHGYDGGFTTSLPLHEFAVEDALIALTHDGQPLDVDHGGPARAIVPQLYAWKSCKWIKAIELTENDQAGYWERGGYHMHGDPWTEERFGG